MKSMIEFLKLIKDLATGTLIGFGIGMLLFILFSINVLWIPLLSVVGAIGGRAYTYYSNKYFGKGSKIEISRQLKDLEESRNDLNPIEYLTYRSALKKRLLFGENYDKIFLKEWKHQEQFRHEQDLRPFQYEDILDEYRFRFDQHLSRVMDRQLDRFAEKHEAKLIDSISKGIDKEIKLKTEAVLEKFLSKKFLENKKELNDFIRAELKSELDLLALDVKNLLTEKIKEESTKEKEKLNLENSKSKSVVSTPNLETDQAKNELEEKSNDIKNEVEENVNKNEPEIIEQPSKPRKKTRRGDKSKKRKHLLRKLKREMKIMTTMTMTMTMKMTVGY